MLIMAGMTYCTKTIGALRYLLIKCFSFILKRFNLLVSSYSDIRSSTQGFPYISNFYIPFVALDYRDIFFS